MSKNKDRDILQNAYAYVLFGSLTESPKLKALPSSAAAVRPADMPGAVTAQDEHVISGTVQVLRGYTEQSRKPPKPGSETAISPSSGSFRK